jgi:hypothetical protein
VFDKIRIERLCNELDAKAHDLIVRAESADARNAERFRIRAQTIIDVSDTVKSLLAAG